MTSRTLYYVANVRMPTEKAHGIQVAKMCEALAKAGAKLTLLIPRRRNGETRDIFQAYTVERLFAIEYVPTIDLPLWIPGAFQLQTLVFAASVRRRLRQVHEPAIVYTRGEIPLFLTTLPSHLSLVWETHIKPDRLLRYKRVATRAVLLVAATKAYAEEIPSLWGVRPDHVLYASDAVSLEDFSNLPSQAACRTQLGLPLDRSIVLYAGSDVAWKGLSLLRDASDLLAENVLTVFVGDISEKGIASPRRLFRGVRPYAETRLWLSAADVLVLTGDPESPIARHYTSPLKLFEYMASSRPIVATDLPSIREILSPENAYLAHPSVEGLATTITRALTDLEGATRKAQETRRKVEAYTWDARAKRILAAIPV